MDAELPHLLAVARRLTRNSHDAHDLVQDALVRALPALARVTTGTHLRAWLTTIVRHVHIDQLRRVAREPFAIPIDETFEESTSQGDDASGESEDAIGIEDIEEALTAIPEHYRRVFVLHALEGRSYREIADALDIPVATVGTRLNRARIKLRELLSDRRDERGRHRPTRVFASTHSERLLLRVEPKRRS